MLRITKTRSDYKERKVRTDKKIKVQNPDVEARFKTDVKEIDLFKHFKSIYDIPTVDSKLYLSIVYDYNLLIIEDILNGDEIKLYPNLGSLMMMQKIKQQTYEKSNGRVVPNKGTNNVDWGLTRKLNLVNKETGKLIPQYFEKQTDYCMCKWVHLTNIPNMYFTKFSTSKTFRRKIPIKLKEDPTLDLMYKDNYATYVEFIENRRSINLPHSIDRRKGFLNRK